MDHFGERIQLRWRDGVFVPEKSEAGSFEKLARDQKVEAIFLMLLNHFAEQSQHVNQATPLPVLVMTPAASAKSLSGDISVTDCAPASLKEPCLHQKILRPTRVQISRAPDNFLALG
jgi:hypothetical protein